jgi:hypothetical protein
MKKFVVMSFGIMLAIAAASPNCWAQIKFDNGGGDLKFLTANNWSDDLVPSEVPARQFAINDGFVVAYDTKVLTKVEAMFVGGDAPITPGDFGTPGRLNISAGELQVTGGGDAFEIGRSCCYDNPGEVSVVELTNDAILRTFGNDPQVGRRDAGQLIIRDTAQVIGDGGNSHWRLGNYGPSIDNTGPFPPHVVGGLKGNGLLDVSDNGKFTAHVIFIGDGDSDGVVRISDNGSVKLTGSLVPSADTSRPNRSALVNMVGSTATLEAVFNLESANGLAEVHNQYLFEADAGGVSAIKLGDAVNISNNDLTVDLNGFDLGPGGRHLLFDAAPNRIFGTFANLTVLGGNPAYTYALAYRNFHHGDIVLQRVPEPSTMVLFGLGMVMVISAKRRASR